MKCAQCGAENQAVARFCHACGKPLAGADTPAPQPAPEPPHPALSAALNLVLFWRPVASQRTAETLKLAGLVGAVILFVHSVRLAFEHGHWIYVFAVLAIAAGAALVWRKAWLAIGAAALLAALSVFDFITVMNADETLPIPALLTRLVVAVLLANGARAVRHEIGEASPPRPMPFVQQPQPIMGKPLPWLGAIKSFKSARFAAIAAAALQVACAIGFVLHGAERDEAAQSYLLAAVAIVLAALMALRMSTIAASLSLSLALYLLAAAMFADDQLMILALLYAGGVGVALYAVFAAEALAQTPQRAPPPLQASLSSLAQMNPSLCAARLLILLGAAALILGAFGCVLDLANHEYETTSLALTFALMLIFAAGLAFAHARLAAAGALGLAVVLLRFATYETNGIVWLFAAAMAAAAAGVTVWRFEPAA